MAKELDDECIFPKCSGKARKHGKECRKCYKRLWAAKKRGSVDAEPREVRLVTLGQAQRELERRAYLEWMNDY